MTNVIRTVGCGGGEHIGRDGCIVTRRLVVGAPELIDFTDADGRIVKRLMRPVLDENGAWVRWVSA